MRVLITAGGGGHFSPALSVIGSLPKDVTYVIVGRKYTYEGSTTLSHEYLLSEKNQLPFIPLTTGRLQRTFTRYTIPSLLKIPVGFWQARKIIADFRPDVVLSFGGYVTVPIVLAASRKKIPIIVHEQTQEVGLANKIASKFADLICISWKSSEQYFPKKKTILTGNPVKPEIVKFMAEKSKKTTTPKIFITGGSQGSHALNFLVKESLSELLTIADIIHLTGDAKQFDDFTTLTQFREQLSSVQKEQYQLHKFLDTEQMLMALSQSSLVISRSGINTLTELLLLEKPALLMPLKDGQKNEQEKNAKLFVSTGLGEMFDEKTTQTIFIEKVRNMVTNIHEYKIRSEIPEIALHLTAAKAITDLVIDVGNKAKNKTG